MRITFLGTGASEGIPALLCECGVCVHARRRRGRNVRQNAAALVTGRGGDSLLIDCPPQIKMAWDRGGFSHDRLLAALVTHGHEDHTLGLKYLVDAHPVNGVTTGHSLRLPLPSDVFELRLRPFLRPSPLLAVTCPRAYEPQTIGSFTVTPLETGHLAADGRGDFGYLIEDSDGMRMAHIVDSPSVLPGRTSEALAGRRLDCLVFEGTFEDSDSTQHTDILGLREVARTVNARVTIATHTSHRNLPHRALQRALSRDGIKAAFDGMTIGV